MTRFDEQMSFFSNEYTFPSMPELRDRSAYFLIGLFFWLSYHSYHHEAVVVLSAAVFGSGLNIVSLTQFLPSFLRRPHVDVPDRLRPHFMTKDHSRVIFAGPWGDEFDVRLSCSRCEVIVKPR